MIASPTLAEDIDWLCNHPRTQNRALGHNLRFDPLVEPGRFAVFEDEFRQTPGSPAFDATIHDGHVVLQAQVRYHERWVEGGAEPQTFGLDNAAASLTKLAPAILLVRFENLTRPLLWAGVDFAVLGRAWSAPTRTPEQIATLQRFCTKWNARAWNTPRFVGLETELRDELRASDWPERLRNRLGLPHFQPGRSGPLHVAVMMYRVSEVRRQSRGRPRLNHHFTRPTVLDQKPFPYFYPAPAELEGGRCMQLETPPPRPKLMTELLHPKIEYRPDHIYRLGTIRSAAPRESLRHLRNRHLDILRSSSSNPSFGEMIPDGVRD